MQMFFLKNLVGVSTAALLFAGISFSTMAEQELTIQEQPKQPEENRTSPMPKLSQLEQGNIPSEEAEAMAPMVPEDLHVDLYEKELEIESDPLSAPLSSKESPDVRVEQRLEALNNAQGGMDTLNPQDEPTDPSLPVPEDMVPLKTQGQASFPSQNIASEEAGLITEGELISPGNAIDQHHHAQELTQEITEGMPATHLQSSLMAKIITPQPVAWDDRANQPELTKPKKDDSSDPTSEGESKHGKKKGQHMTDPRMIPIIRMGENLTQDGGFAIIKSWNN